MSVFSKYFKIIYLGFMLIVFAVSYFLQSLYNVFFYQSIIIIIFSFLGYLNSLRTENFRKDKKARRLKKIRKLAYSQFLILIVVIILQNFIWRDTYNMLPFIILQMILVFLVMNTTLWQIERKSRY
jgi:hypothetical protein